MGRSGGTPLLVLPRSLLVVLLLLMELPNKDVEPCSSIESLLVVVPLSVVLVQVVGYHRSVSDIVGRDIAGGDAASCGTVSCDVDQDNTGQGINSPLV